MFKNLLLAAAALASLVDAVARTSPPPGAIVVAPSGGQFTSLQAAIKSIPISSTTPHVIFVKPGSYAEQVLVPALAGKLTIYGYTTDDQHFANNQVTIINSLGADKAGSNDASGTLRIQAANFAAYNLNVHNSRGPGVQAIAVSAQGGNQGFYGCKFIGYQDTVLANKGKQIYDKCYIEGAVDFIFGSTAVAWFQTATIAIAGKGCITANGRDSASNPSFYVLNEATISAKEGVTLPDRVTYLGRPWRNYSRVVVQHSDISGLVNPLGWREWAPGQPLTDHVYYREYNNSGTGAKGTRANFSKTLDTPVTLLSIMGTTDWIDMHYWKNV